MTDSPRLPPAVEDRLAALRRRRAELAADRAAFEERRRYGLRARRAAKLAYLAERRPDHDPRVTTTEEEPIPRSPKNPDAA